MIIPKKVKIGAITYQVRIQNSWFERGDVDGETFYNEPEGNVIYIFSGLSREAQEATFIHEALHCMNSTVNHEFLDSLAEQLYQFLSDNKLLK